MNIETLNISNCKKYSNKSVSQTNQLNKTSNNFQEVLKGVEKNESKSKKDVTNTKDSLKKDDLKKLEDEEIKKRKLKRIKDNINSLLSPFLYYLDNNTNLGEELKDNIEDILKKTDGNISLENLNGILDKIKQFTEKLNSEVNKEKISTYSDINNIKIDFNKLYEEIESEKLNDVNKLNDKETLKLEKLIQELIKDKHLTSCKEKSSETSFKDELNKKVDILKDSDPEISLKNTDNLHNNSSVIEKKDHDEFLKELLGNNDKKFSLDKINLNMLKMQGLNEIPKETPNIENIRGNTIVNKEFFTNDIIKWVKYMNLNDIKELTLKVVPRELGELVLKVSVESGNMKAEILANNKETYQLLQNNMEDLIDKLNGDKIKVQDFSVNIYDGNRTGSNKENFRDNKDEFLKESKKRRNINAINIEDNEDYDENNYLSDVLNKLA